MTPTIRCSELDRVLLCPGSLTLNAIVKPREGDDGYEGTVLHAIAHNRMITELKASGHMAVINALPKSIDFSAWIAGFYFDFVRETVPSTWSLEVEAEMAYEFDRFILSGHIDALAMSPDATEAIIFDLKTGYDPVDTADSNEQVFGYGVTLIKAYPLLTKITAYIIQPRNDEDEGYQRISPPMILEGGVLANSVATMERRVGEALENLMTVETSPKACKWCSAAIQCPAAIRERESMKIKMTEADLLKIKEVPDDPVLGSWVVSAKILARPIKDATELAKERIEAKGHIVSTEGVVITASTEPGMYKWLNPVAAFEALKRRVVTDAKMAVAMSMSVTKARDTIAEVMNIPKTGKAEVTADKIVRDELKIYAEQGTRTVLQFTQ